MAYANGRQPGAVSVILVLSYLWDWIIIAVFALIAWRFNQAAPNDRAFSLLDLDISFPMVHETVSSTVLAVVAIVAPAAIIFLVAVLAIPGPAASRMLSRGQLLRRKLWEWNSGWLGLGLSITTTLLIVSGMKNLIGRPRPDMLSRCVPDLARLAESTVGGYGQDIADRWVLVNPSICTQTDQAIMYDGFRSFPSGHASTSFAGLLYLALYLCSKFAVVMPYLPSESMANSASRSNASAGSRRFHGEDDNPKRPMLLTSKPGEGEGETSTRHRDEAAAPPVYLLFLLYVPVGTALFISGTRFFNYRHHGFDIIAGALIGCATAYFSFRLYHLPMARGSGWSWGPRSRSRAFGIGVGSHGYVEAPIPHGRSGSRDEDVEMGVYGDGGRVEPEYHGPGFGRVGRQSPPTLPPPTGPHRGGATLESHSHAYT